jgi:hypothetical protein
MAKTGARTRAQLVALMLAGVAEGWPDLPDSS